MKSFIVTFLVLAIFLETGGLLLIGKVQQWNIRSEMRRRLENEEENLHLETLILSRHQWQQSKIHDDELQWAGEMYDVKELFFKGDSVILSVVNDVEETKIKGSLDKLTASLDNNAPFNRDISKKIIKSLTLKYLVPKPEVFSIENPISHKQRTAFRLNSFAAVTYKPKAPPPEQWIHENEFSYVM